MTKEQQRVKEWMQNFVQEVLEQPTQVSKDVARLRAKLILEETLEIITKGLGFQIFITTDGMPTGAAATISENNLKDIGVAFLKMKEVDLVETIDGLCDLHYVSYTGTGCALGVDLEPAFEEVCNSNDSKMWTEEEVKTRDKEKYPYAEIRDIPGDRKFIVTREDGKIMKSPSYSPADIKSVLEKQKVKNEQVH